MDSASNNSGSKRHEFIKSACMAVTGLALVPGLSFPGSNPGMKNIHAGLEGKGAPVMHSMSPDLVYLTLYFFIMLFHVYPVINFLFGIIKLHKKANNTLAASPMKP